MHIPTIMSDRYRPPSGPRSNRDYDSGKSSSSSSSYRSSYKNDSRNGYKPTPRRFAENKDSRYSERDNVDPRYSERGNNDHRYSERDNRYPDRDHYRPRGDFYQPPPRRPLGPSKVAPAGPSKVAPAGPSKLTPAGPSKMVPTGPSKMVPPQGPSREAEPFSGSKRPSREAEPFSGSKRPSREAEPSIGSKRPLVPSEPRGYRKKREFASSGPERYQSNYYGDKYNGPPRSNNIPLKEPRFVPKSKVAEPAPGAPKLSMIFSVKISNPTEIYKRVQQVGEGTYGKVYKATNTITNDFVALKKLRLESEREGFPITAMREIKLLQSFDHENIVGLLEMMVEHNQIYMVFDYLDHDLTGLLTHPDLKLEECHRKYIFKQLIEGLNYLHKKRVIHRDIKGSNLLLDSTGQLKIADFGLARTMKIVNNGESPDYTNRVITIWYRPPELLLGATDYGREVDIWGVGCLLIELYSKIAAFQGFDEVGQLCKIYNVMGTPTLEDWPEIEHLPWFEMLKPKLNVASQFKQKYETIMSPQSFDLAQKLLALNPRSRLTAEQALTHEYFTKDPAPEPLTFLKDIKGEWHEFETKQRRRTERKRLQDEARAKAKVNNEDISNSIQDREDVETTGRDKLPPTAPEPESI